MSKCRNRILIQRIKDKIFLPLLENNGTNEEKEGTDEEDIDDDIDEETKGIKNPELNGHG